MKRSFVFTLVLVPWLILMLLASILLVERSEVKYKASYPSMQILAPAKVDPKEYFRGKQSDTLVLYDSGAFAGAEHVKTVIDVLGSMQVKYDSYDVRLPRKYDLSKYNNVVVSFIDLQKYEDRLPDLMQFVERGGRLLFSIRPDPSPAFNGIYRKLGIISKSDGLVVAKGVEFASDLIPGTRGLKIGADFIISNSYFVELEPQCKVHLKSADTFQTPILWECGYHQGRFVVLNSDQFNTKSDRGMIGAAFSLLQDVFIYPVINGSIYYIDEFPGPIKGGAEDLITKQYGRDIQNFYTNIWWPDIQQLSHKYGIRFTGAFLETFNDSVSPPFSKQRENERYRYFGGLVLDNKGELGLQGFNHVPLCLASAGVNQQLDYPGWSSPESMELSIYEAYSFTRSIFPDTKLTTYIPPSNILCPEARRWLPQALPDLKVISSLYLPGEGGLAYEQEFTEAPDGIIELPRIAGGYELPSYMHWAAVNELVLHYINSYYISPHEVLSDAQGQQKGWAYLYNQFEQYVKGISESAPGMRNLTAIEGGIAVQRFARLAISTQIADSGADILLGNFYDEAWLMMRTLKTPLSIEGGKLTQVSPGLYLIQALKPELTIKFQE